MAITGGYGDFMELGAFRETKRRLAEGLAGRSVAVALGLAAAVALSACDSRNRQEVPVASTADLSATSTIAEAAPDAVRDAATVAPTRTAALVDDDVGAEAEAEIALAVDSFQSAEPADPDEVMGLGRNAVQALLGEPGLVRREAPAEVWQYQSRGCVLDVFLYEASSDFQVVYLEARTGQAIGTATATCLGAVLDRRRATPSS